MSDSSNHGIFQARVPEWVAISFIQRIFPTRGSNPGLPHSRQTLYHLSHQGSSNSFKKAFLSLLSVLWNFAFNWANFSLSPLPFTSLLSSAICEASTDKHFVFLHFFFFGMVLVTASCTLQTSIQSSSGTLSSRSNLSFMLLVG